MTRKRSQKFQYAYLNMKRVLYQTFCSVSSTQSFLLTLEASETGIDTASFPEQQVLGGLACTNTIDGRRGINRYYPSNAFYMPIFTQLANYYQKVATLILHFILRQTGRHKHRCDVPSDLHGSQTNSNISSVISFTLQFCMGCEDRLLKHF